MSNLERKYKHPKIEMLPNKMERVILDLNHENDLGQIKLKNDMQILQINQYLKF